MRKVLDLEKLVTKYNMNIKGVIHIGAHFGEENRVYDALNIKNRIFFEPLESNLSVLEQRLKDRFPVIKKALGNENKKVTMYVEKENRGQSSSILKPALHLIQYPNIKFEETEVVDMARLDDLGIDFTDYNFISVDVQGYELEVFKGAEKTLKQIDYIVSEINKEELYENCAKVGELVEFLSPYGFKLVEEAWVGSSWGDGLFIRSLLSMGEGVKNNWLSDYSKNITSQRGEDGILEKIFEVLKIDRGWCVDVGAHGKNNSNTFSLITKGWSGVLIEKDKQSLDHLKELYNRHQIYIIDAEARPEGENTLDNLLEKTPIAKRFDFLNIDIDGNDYYIWQSIKNYSPTIVVIEFNPVSKLYDYLQPIDGRGGCSLTQLIKLGKSKGYELVATTSFNAFFVKEDLFHKFGIKNNSAGEMITESNDSYGNDKTLYGHTRHNVPADV